MNTRRFGWFAAMLAFLLVSVAARASDSAATDARWLLENDAKPSLSLSAFTQFRYLANFRDDDTLGDSDTTAGFVANRTKVSAKGKVTDSLSGRIQITFSGSSGTASLEYGYGDWEIAEGVTLRFGQYKPSLIHEENVSASAQLTMERSGLVEEFTVDISQGIQLTIVHDGWLRLVGGINDGIRQRNTFYTGENNDIAVTGRIEALLGKAGFGRFKKGSSFHGENSGALIGAGVHYQSAASTNIPAPMTDQDITVLTADATYMANGWSLNGAVFWRRTDTTTMNIDDLGWQVQGAVFLSEHSELYARYWRFEPDSIAGATKLGVMSIGWNHYLIPDSNAAKFTLEVTQHFDPITQSGIRVSSTTPHLADTTDNQIVLAAQIQIKW